MIRLADLARLAEQHRDALASPVAPVRIGGRTFDTDREPVLMGVVNLSRDSTYRESIAVSVEAAVRKASVQAAQGAHLVDIGAESSRATAAAVSPHDQASAVVPVIAELASRGVATSIEGYSPEVAQAGLEAGASTLNLTGSTDDDAMFALAAEHDAAVVLCHVLGPHARALSRSTPTSDPLGTMRAHFEPRLDAARARGVTNLVIDPGLGFGFHLDDHEARARFQAEMLVGSAALRTLGVPLCHALPHAFDLFEDEFRSAEGFFATFAHLGGTGVHRVHEVSLVRAALRVLGEFSLDGL